VKDSERMVISAYLDGEVEAPWKDEVARKISQDPVWAAEAAAQSRLRDLVLSAPEPDFREERIRVFERLEGLSPRPEVRLPLVWLSVAAAALVVMAAGGGFWWGRSSVTPGAVDVAELQVQVPKQLELKLSGEGQLLMASTLEGTRP